MTGPSKILSGKAVAEFHQDLLRGKIDRLQKERGGPLALSLATVQIGESADIELYSTSLGRVLSRYGIKHIEKKFSVDPAKQDRLHMDLVSLYNDPAVTGVMVFSPIPPSVDALSVFINMPLDKDIEGRTFLKRNPFGVFSPTGKAVFALLRYLERTDKSFKISGKHAVMVGHSDLVGKPTMALLLDAEATVTVCHKNTSNLPDRIAQADILVVAIGKPRFIQGSWIKEGAVVVDVGENVVDGKIVGDVDFEAACEKAAYVSPVPGGVGPLTSLMVIENLLMMYEYKRMHGINGNR